MTELFNLEKQKDRRRELRRQMSYTEKLFWHQVNNNKLGYRFRRQFGIGKYIVDFYCPRWQLVIEIDGPTHESEEDQGKDKIRQDFLESLGLKVRRYHNLEIR
jgi:very-short-patch-repair endonuclease